MLFFLLACTANSSKPIDTANTDSADADTDTAVETDIEAEPSSETGETGTTESPECGNNIVEEGERCDDGNSEDFDNCGFQCTVINQAQAYTPHNQIITNPERGFYRQKNIIIGQGTPTDITEELRAYRDENMSLVLLMFDLREFQDQDISTEALADIDTYFNQVRAAGLKAILRFRYTDSYEAPADATPEQTLSHVQQLQSILLAHSDIIFVFQAGFVGVYGEWYSTDHWGEPLAWSAEDTENRRLLTEAMLDSLDFGRSVQLRTPYYRKDLFGDAHACHDGSTESRLGIFNDCFLAPYNDMGTYLDSSDRDWLIEDSACTPVGGETCVPDPPRSECAFALSEMELLHWSYLNSGYNQEILEGWSDIVQTDLIPRGAVWKYDDTGSDLGTSWIDANYDDSGWASGPAELGYGDGDESTVISFGSDASNKHITSYFRHSFTVSTLPTEDLTVDLKMDDGAIVYLNGQEIIRSNMPAGVVNYDTPAGNNTVSESNFFSFEIDPSLLILGENIMTAEVHQISSSSSDISFDLGLHVNMVDETVGCMSQIKRELGYRLVIEDSLFAQEASAGATIPIDLDFKNLGFSAPINPRDIILHLQSENTGQLWSLSLDSDPREWLPQETPWNIRLTAGLPADIPEGNYSWLLTLPDPTPTLSDLPDFAIQLANENLWNEEHHWHDLGQTLLISDNISGVLYDGEHLFEAQD